MRTYVRCQARDRPTPASTALKTGNLTLIRNAAAELPRLDLGDALAVCLAVRWAEPERFERAELRCLACFCLERREATLAQVRAAAWAFDTITEAPAALATLQRLCSRLWMSPGVAFAAPPVLGGEFEMRAVVIQEQGLSDRSEGTRYSRTLRFRRVAGGRCAWRLAFETVNGDFERSRACRTGAGRYVSRDSYTRQCGNDAGSARGHSVLRFRVTRRVTRDGRRYVARIAGRFRATYLGDCEPRSASETWKFSARRMDLPPAPAAPSAEFVVDPSDPSITGARNAIFFTDVSDDSNDNGTIKRWSWNFGDPGSGLANTATVAEPSHTSRCGRELSREPDRD